MKLIQLSIHFIYLNRNRLNNQQNYYPWQNTKDNITKSPYINIYR